MDDRYDVVVVGGGAAGLAGAVALARARRTVLVVDAGQPRNAPAAGVHNYLGREGTPPAELVAAGRDEVAGYGGQIVAGRVDAVARDGTGFVVTVDGGRAVRARRLLVTTGLVDELPEVPGLTERWGRDVLHCPYCHGWEARDRRIGVLATGPLAAHQAQLWRQWSPHVRLLLHDAAQPGPRRPSGWPRGASPSYPAGSPRWRWSTTGSPGCGWPPARWSSSTRWWSRRG
ncbi:NAD(P)/FAD-dependent oxidoreductase [Micromonospora sp. Llam7]|nr:NAD(P)/FAD-dependent oxidoreductase [Micromonospora tarapacensis]